jgi:hypothetical protein
MDPPYPYHMQIFLLATNCWIRQTWQFMDAHQIRIEDTTPDFLLSRANDQLLIPLFHEKGIRDDHLHRLNLCRLFLQVLTISISQLAAEPRSPRPHGRGYVTLHERRATNGQHKDYQCPGLDTVAKILTKALSLQTANRLTPTRAMASYSAVSVVLDAPTERLYQKVGLDTIYYPRAPGRPSRNALMKFDRSLGTLTPGSCFRRKGLRSKVRTTSCGLRDTVQVAHQRSR